MPAKARTFTHVMNRVLASDGGFTLVELTVALTVVLVMAGAALLAAPGIIKDSNKASCDATADSVANAITASYAKHGDYSQASATDLVSDAYLVTEPEAAKLVIGTASASGVTVTFGDACSGYTAPTTWGADAQGVGSYQYGTSDAPGECASGGGCEVGDIGPGGGKVFYIDNDGFDSNGNTAKYLEVANPATWQNGNGDPSIVFGCENIPANAASTSIGSGAKNTSRLLTAANGACSNNQPMAALSAFGYDGGGKIDWYLPAKDELNQLCLWATGQPTGPDELSTPCPDPAPSSLPYGLSVGATYWTSSEAVTARSYALSFTDGFSSKDKGSSYKVRPIRAFAPTN